MAVNPYVATGVVLGLLSVAVYVVIARANGVHPELGSAVRMLLGAAGIPAGGKLCIASVFEKNLSGFSPDERPYIFVGGFAVLWVSLEQILVAISEERRSKRGGSGSS